MKVVANVLFHIWTADKFQSLKKYQQTIQNYWQNLTSIKFQHKRQFTIQTYKLKMTQIYKQHCSWLILSKMVRRSLKSKMKWSDLTFYDWNQKTLVIIVFNYSTLTKSISTNEKFGETLNWQKPKTITAGNKSIAAIGAWRKYNQQQCISKLYIRRTEFYRSLVLNFNF